MVTVKSTTTVTEGVKKKKRKEKTKSRTNHRTNQNLSNNKCFSQISAVGVLLLVVSHSPPAPPGILSNTGLVSGPAGGQLSSDPVLLLCILFSSAHSCQSHCAYVYGNSYCSFRYSIDTESAWLTIWI